MSACLPSFSKSEKCPIHEIWRFPSKPTKVCRRTRTRKHPQTNNWYDILSKRKNLTARNLFGRSMTSVPKPLKFLRPHLQTLKETFSNLAEGENKKLLADIISLLAMTDAPVENVMPESLKYRLLGSGEDIGTWGHEVGPGTRRVTNLTFGELLGTSVPSGSI